MAEGQDIPGITRPMTYEEYLASPVEKARYDIIDGYKVYHRFGKNNMTSPTRLHQDVQGNIFVAFRQYALSTKNCRAYQSAVDGLVKKNPTRTRQPDVMLISDDRLLKNPPPMSRPLLIRPRNWSWRFCLLLIHGE
jgi:Uma2 family endonuclease